MNATTITELQRLADAATNTLTDRRDELAKHAQAGHRADTLSTYLNRVADAEARAGLIGYAARIAQNDGDVREYLWRELTRGADDTWSGRGNDVKRAEFDGLRNAADQIVRLLDRVEAAA